MEAAQPVKPAAKKPAALPAKETTLEMLKEGGIPVVTTYLHQASMIAGTPLVEKTLNARKFPGALMTWTSHGLIFEIKDKGTKLNRVSLIPHAAIQSCEINIKQLEA